MSELRNVGRCRASIGWLRANSSHFDILLRTHAAADILRKHEIPRRGAVAISVIRKPRSIFEGSNLQIADFADIQFPRFADAASVLTCGAFIALTQYMSPDQPLTDPVFPRSETELSLLPSLTIQTRDKTAATPLKTNGCSVAARSPPISPLRLTDLAQQRAEAQVF